jgi:hypothetical protein
LLTIGPSSPSLVLRGLRVVPLPARVFHSKPATVRVAWIPAGLRRFTGSRSTAPSSTISTATRALATRREQGGECGQGFLSATPLPGEKIDELLGMAPAGDLAGALDPVIA